jgi:hypothetical protein
MDRAQMRGKILEVLSDAEKLTTSEVAKKTGFSVRDTSNLLMNLLGPRYDAVEVFRTPRGTHEAMTNRTWRRKKEPKPHGTKPNAAEEAVLKELEVEGLLGMLPDVQLAKAYGIPHYKLRRRRVKLGIPHHKRGKRS